MHGTMNARFNFLQNYKVCTALCALNIFCNKTIICAMVSTHIKATEYAFKYKIYLMCMDACKLKYCIFGEKGNI